MPDPSIYTRIDRFLHGGDYNPDQWLQWPEIIDEDFRLMPLAGCNTFSINIFGWAACEPREGTFTFEWLDRIMDRLAEAGHHAILATPSGSKPAWMSKKYPEVRRVDAQGIRDGFVRRHNHCFSSPVYREKVDIMNTRLAERYQDHPALILWHVSNEYGGTCYCDLCKENFRHWLRERYGTIEALNTAWWTRFWSHTYNDFDEIDATPDPTVEGMQLDWRRFTTHMTLDFFKAESAPLRKITPDVPVTINMMSLYNGLDYNEFAPHIDVATNDSYPGLCDDDTLTGRAQRNAFACDWLRNVKKGRPWLLMESCPSATNWQAVSKLKAPGIHMLEMMSNIAHGADGTLYFQWRKSRGGSEKFHGAVVDHVGHENTRVFREVAEVGGRLKNLRPVLGSTTTADAALIFDWDARWALELSWGPKNNDDPTKGYCETLQAWHRGFWENNLAVDVIDSMADLSGYKLVAAPMLFLLKDGVADRLKTFVEGGGTLLLTYLTGHMDQRDLCHLSGWPGDGLIDLLGLWVEEIDALVPSDKQTMVRTADAPGWLQGRYPVDTYCDVIHPKDCDVLAVCGSDFYKGQPAVTCKKSGSGRTYYVGGRSNGALVTDMIKGLAADSGCTPCLNGSLPEPVRARRRTKDGTSFIFLQNYSGRAQTVRLDNPLTDLETGVKVNNVTLSRFGVSVLQEG